MILHHSRLNTNNSYFSKLLSGWGVKSFLDGVLLGVDISMMSPVVNSFDSLPSICDNSGVSCFESSSFSDGTSEFAGVLTTV